jgi:hypothetical protein
MTARTVKAADAGDWRAAAFWLERRRPDSFGNRSHLALQLNLRQLTDRLAEASGLSAAAILAEAERIMREFRQG